MVNGAIHHAVIGEGERGHIHFGGALGHVFDAIGAVEQRILGMDVKMAKTAGTFRHQWKPELKENLTKMHFGIAKRGASRGIFAAKMKAMSLESYANFGKIRFSIGLCLQRQKHEKNPMG